MAKGGIKAGDHVVSSSGYSARSFLLDGGESVAADPAKFDQSAHEPRLLIVSADEKFQALTDEHAGGVYVKVERDGQTYAAALLPGRFSKA